MISYMSIHINAESMPVEDPYDSGTRLKLSKIRLCKTKHILCQDAKTKLGNIKLDKHHSNVRPSEYLDWLCDTNNG